ncbi:MAG: BON domain-containing protein [Chloroflexi bacterium]|nr:BON domain-containing protein [Chloroflexota bacterium]
MSELAPTTALTRRLERQLAASGLQVVVEASDGGLILSGVVDSDESRQAALDIVTQAAPPDTRIDDQLEIVALLPTNVDDFASDAPTADLVESEDDIEAEGSELEPDFTDRPGFSDPLQAAGAGGSEEEDLAESGEVYTPPIDPVITTGTHGEAQVLGGFGLDATDDVAVERSAEDRAPGDEALADAIRRELAEDSATTDLNIHVVVRNGVAYLRGQVADLDDSDNAESVAARVPGVRDVVEELDVAGL